MAGLEADFDRFQIRAERLQIQNEAAEEEQIRIQIQKEAAEEAQIQIQAELADLAGRLQVQEVG